MNKQELIRHNRRKIAQLKKMGELSEHCKADLESAEIALAALMAGESQTERDDFEQFMAWRFGDSINRSRAKNGDEGYMAWDMIVAWETWQRRALPEYLNTRQPVFILKGGSLKPDGRFWYKAETVAEIIRAGGGTVIE